MTLIQTTKNPTSPRIWGLDPLFDLPVGTVVVDLGGKRWEIVGEIRSRADKPDSGNYNPGPHIRTTEQLAKITHRRGMTPHSESSRFYDDPATDR